MTLEECFELANKFKVVYSEMNLSEGGDLYIGTIIDGEHIHAKCTNLDEYKDFCMNIKNETARNMLLTQYNTFNFEWVRYAENYENTIVEAHAWNIPIEISKRQHQINLSLSLDV